MAEDAGTGRVEAIVASCDEPNGLAGSRLAEPDRAPGPSVRRFTITVEGCGTATATSDERVLVALERAQGFGRLKGLPRKLPVGCRRGGCGICKARVLDGDYRVAAMSRAHVSAEEAAAGVVLSCAVYALSDLTLRLETPVLGKEKGQTATRT